MCVCVYVCVYVYVCMYVCIGEYRYRREGREGVKDTLTHNTQHTIHIYIHIYYIDGALDMETLVCDVTQSWADSQVCIKPTSSI
jgi:hypothetical protein